MKVLLAFLGVLVFSAMALAADQPAIEQLRRDLVGQSFALRLQIAGSTCLQEQGMSFPTSRLVDTEINDDDVRYYLRADRFMNIRQCSHSEGDTGLGGTYLDPLRIPNMHRERSMMTVKQIDAKPDRIEVRLAEVGQSGDQAYGKIKLMLGTGYESKSLEQLEMSLARALELPRIRDLVQARNAYNSIENDISTLEASLSAELPARQKVANATKLLTLYDQERTAASRVNQVAFSPLQVPQTPAKIDQTKKALAGFKLQADKENVDAVLNHYAAAAIQMKTDCQCLLSGGVKTRGELISQISAVDTARHDLSIFESARREALSLSQPIPQSDEAYSTKCADSCDALSQTFAKKEETVRAAEAVAAEAERQRQEKEAQLERERLRSQQLERVDEDYRKFKKHKAALDAKLVTALGGPEEYALYSVYRNLMEEMLQNRQRARELGCASAEQEIRALNTQLQRLQQ